MVKKIIAGKVGFKEDEKMRKIKKIMIFAMLIFVFIFQVETNAETVEVGSYRFTLYAGADYVGTTSAVTKVAQTQSANVHVGTYTAGGSNPTRAYVNGPVFTPEILVRSTGTYYLWYSGTAKTGLKYVLNFISNKNNLNNTKVAGSWTP